MRKTNLLLVLLVCFTLTSISAFAFPLAQTTHINFWLPGDLHAYDYASKVDFFSSYGSDGWLNGTWIGTDPDLAHYLNWEHALHVGLAVSPNQITGAKIWIDGGNNARVTAGAPMPILLKGDPVTCPPPVPEPGTLLLLGSGILGLGVLRFRRKG